jgi:hypothetical protein
LRVLRKGVERGRCALCGKIKMIIMYFDMQGEKNLFNSKWLNIKETAYKKLIIVLK